MIARVWHGVVSAEKADDYARYLTDSDLGVRDYASTPGNRGYTLLRRRESDRAHFLLVSLWDSSDAIRAYAGADIGRARYHAFDLECLLEPEPSVEHYEVLSHGEGEAP
jgi:heme-degrading monooxygenase HmoA